MAVLLVKFIICVQFESTDKLQTIYSSCYDLLVICPSDEDIISSEKRQCKNDVRPVEQSQVDSRNDFIEGVYGMEKWNIIFAALQKVGLTERLMTLGWNNH